MRSGGETDRLRKLEERIETLKKAQSPDPKEEEHYSLAQRGWRMVTELVAGLLIGFGIGYGLDAIFGTIPIFTVLFLFAGFAAGVKVMLRTANEFHGVAERRAAAAQATPGEPGAENLPGAPGAQTGPDGQPDGKQKEG